MNNLINIDINAGLTMSSLEIAELTGKNHADVLRDIRNMMAGLNLGESSFAGTYLSNQNKELPCFNLPKRETLILVSGYNIELRTRIIDRWQELENQTPAYHLPTTFHEALRMLADESEKNLILENKIKDDLPYTSFAKKIENSSNAIPLGVYSKILKIKDLGPNNMIKFLRENGILIKSGRRKNCPLQKYIQSGWFEIKESTFKTPKGQQVIGFTTLITGSGQIEIAKKFGWNYPLDMD